MPCAMLMCEGMVSTATFSKIFALPLTTVKLENPSPQAVFEWVRRQSLMAPDQKEIHTYAELFRFMMSGFVVLLIDGIEAGSVFGIPGLFRPLGGRADERGQCARQPGGLHRDAAPKHVAFAAQDQIARPHFRHVRTRHQSRTDCMLVYLKDMVSPALLREVKYRLSKVKIDVVLETGYIQPFLDDKPLSLFSGVGYTERPDTLCAKVAEGRIGILMDGTPYALIVPYLFNENFQSADDYSHRPYFATFIRWLKYAAFFFSILLPGLYVGVGTFHPELLPDTLLMSLVASEESTPFPLMIEALVIFFIYEIMREAGLRMPARGRPCGEHCGRAGHRGRGRNRGYHRFADGDGRGNHCDQLVCCAIPLRTGHHPSLRFYPYWWADRAFGIALGMCAVLVNLCAVNPLGVPATAPATPFSLYSMRDVLFRWSWRTLAREDLRVQDLAGSDIRDDKAKEE